MTTAIERLRECADADEYPPMSADIREVLADLDAWKASALKANREIGALRTALAYHGGAAALAMVDAALASPAPEPAVAAPTWLDPQPSPDFCVDCGHYMFGLPTCQNCGASRLRAVPAPPPATPGDDHE